MAYESEDDDVTAKETFDEVQQSEGDEEEDDAPDIKVKQEKSSDTAKIKEELDKLG